MSLVIVFIANYLIYFLGGWALVTGWYFHNSKGSKGFVLWMFGFIAAAIVAYVVVTLVGQLYYEDRPFVHSGVIPPIPYQSTNSFPSSHATFAALFAMFIWFKYRVWGAVAMVVAILVSAGRVLVGVHFVQDVVVGMAIGIGVSFLVEYFWPRSWE